MDVEYDSELSNTDYEEIDDSDTIYMYEPIRRERDEDFLMTLIFRFLLLFNDSRMFWEKVKYFVFSFPTFKNAGSNGRKLSEINVDDFSRM